MRVFLLCILAILSSPVLAADGGSTSPVSVPLSISEMNAAVADFGIPTVIRPIKNGGTIMAVVWEYPKLSHFSRSVILIDGQAVAITINGIPWSYSSKDVNH